MRNKIWITAVELSRSGDRILQNIPPTQAEYVSGRFIPLEGKYKGKKLCSWNHGIHQSPTIEDAIERYNSSIDDCQNRILAHKEALDKKYKDLESLRIK